MYPKWDFWFENKLYFEGNFSGKIAFWARMVTLVLKRCPSMDRFQKVRQLMNRTRPTFDLPFEMTTRVTRLGEIFIDWAIGQFCFENGRSSPNFWSTFSTMKVEV
jgi:hypothetical protein